MDKIDVIQNTIKELEKKATDIIGTAVIRTNGLIITSFLPSESQANERMIAAMSAALLGTSKKAAEALFSGNFLSLNLELDKGNMFLMGAGRVILVAITKKESNIGLITLEMEDACNKIKKIFPVEEGIEND